MSSSTFTDKKDNNGARTPENKSALETKRTTGNATTTERKRNTGTSTSMEVNASQTNGANNANNNAYNASSSNTSSNANNAGNANTATAMSISSNNSAASQTNSRYRELKHTHFGAYESHTAPSPIYFSGNPLNKAKAQWGQQQCQFSQMFKFLTGKDTEPCGKAERSSEACDKCQQLQPFFMRQEWCREVPAQDVHLLGNYVNQAFLLPDGCRLVVFSSTEEAQASKWGQSPYVHERSYTWVNPSGQRAVCFHCCKNCKRCEVRPVQGYDATHFCKKGDLVAKTSLASNPNEPNKRSFTVSQSRSSRGFGRPDPCRFVFNESTFPVDVKIPEGVLLKQDNQGQPGYLTADDIVVFFDDVLMPFTIQNNIITVKVSENPFFKLYRPKEYDNLAITVAVYKKDGRVPTPGLNLANNPSQQNLNEQARTNTQNSMDTKNEGRVQSQTSMDTKSDSKQSSNPVKGSAHGDILYKSTFRFYTRSPELGDGASDSESDEDEQAIPKGVVPKRRYHMPEHLQLSMTHDGQVAFYTVIQGYLRGGFFHGTEQDRAAAKTKRNSLFTDCMKQDVKAARSYVAEMLVEVAQYYMTYCKQEPDYKEGILQLLDFSHALGEIGVKPFAVIIKDSPFINPNKNACFRFQRKFGAEIKNCIVTVSPKFDVTESIEQGDEFIPGKSLQGEKKNDDNVVIVDHATKALSAMSLQDSNETTALDDPDEEIRGPKFPPATGMILKPGLFGGSSDVKDLNDPLVNSSLRSGDRPDDKRIDDQIQIITFTVATYPTPLKNPKEAITALLKATQEAGYMSATDLRNNQVSELTQSYWRAGLAWSVILLGEEDLDKASMNEAKFVQTMGRFLTSRQYCSFDLDYTQNLHVSHLRKLFRLYSSALAPAGQLDPQKPAPMMHPVAFVQCVLLMLLPNGMRRPDHKFLAHHGPLNLASAIDCIYDALTNPKTEKWLQLFRGPISRPAAEAAWRSYKANESKDENVPFFLRLSEARIEHNIAYGLNLMECFEHKGKFTHLMLACDVYVDNNPNYNVITQLVDGLGEAQSYLNDWLVEMMDFSFAEPTSNTSGSKGKSRYIPRRKRFKGGDTEDSGFE